MASLSRDWGRGRESSSAPKRLPPPHGRSGRRSSAMRLYTRGSSASLSPDRDEFLKRLRAGMPDRSVEHPPREWAARRGLLGGSAPRGGREFPAPASLRRRAAALAGDVRSSAHSDPSERPSPAAENPPRDRPDHPAQLRVPKRRRPRGARNGRRAGAADQADRERTERRAC